MTEEEVIVIEELEQLVEKSKDLREEEFYSIFTIHEIQNIATSLNIIQKQQAELEPLRSDAKFLKIENSRLSKENERLKNIEKLYIEHTLKNK